MRDGTAHGVGGELYVVGRPEAAIRHLHHPRLIVHSEPEQQRPSLRSRMMAEVA